MNAKFLIVMGIIKRFVVPIMVGAAVGWLIANGYNHWADALCSISHALGFDVTECINV